MKFFNAKLKSSADFYTQIALMLVLVILIEFIFGLLPLRMDATEAKIFSISEVTKNTLKELDDVVTIKAFFTEDLPGYLLTVRQESRDILEEYKSYGGAKLEIQWINPNKETRLGEEAQRHGIPPLQLNVVRKDKFELAQGYMGMAVIYGDKIEPIPVIQDTSTLEYDLTTAIKKVTSGKDFTIGILEKQGALTEADDLRILKEVLSRQYRVVSIDLEEGKLIDPNISTLIIPGAGSIFSDRELYIIDQFIMSGRSALVFVDGVKVGEGLTAEPNSSSILQLLSSYGVTVNQDLVFDPRYQGEASFSGAGGFTFFTRYGYWPKIPATGFNQESAIVNKLETLLFPWVSTITVKDTKGIQTLVETSNFAEQVSGQFDLLPQSLPAAQNTGEFKVAVQLQGSLKSYFEKQILGEEAGSDAKEEAYKGEADNTRLIVVSDADFITDGFLQRSESNLIFAQNAVDSLTLDESLATIRSKAVTERPIRELDDTARILVKYGNTIGVPFIVVLFAVFRLIWRKKSQRIL